MNNELQDFARSRLKEGLKKCTEDQQQLFKRMYSNGNLELPIDTVIDRMPAGNLDWAMEQVRRTIEKNERKATDAG